MVRPYDIVLMVIIAGLIGFATWSIARDRLSRRRAFLRMSAYSFLLMLLSLVPMRVPFAYLMRFSAPSLCFFCFSPLAGFVAITIQAFAMGGIGLCVWCGLKNPSKRKGRVALVLLAVALVCASVFGIRGALRSKHEARCVADAERVVAEYLDKHPSPTLGASQQPTGAGPRTETSGDYLIIDLSGGPSASNYPVTSCESVPAGGWTDEHKTTKLVLRRIPAGTFIMGSPTDELGRESNETQHQVTLTQDFHIGVFEVTQKQWERVMGNWPSYFTNITYRDSRPVERVSYYEIRENPEPIVDEWTKGSGIGPNWPRSSQVHADSFMGKLRAKTGLTTLDLPTESQWEYAGRAGTTTALNSGHNLTSTRSDPQMDEVGRYWHNGGKRSPPSGDTSVGSAKVGSYAANAWGLYDIHGNVWEWCLDRLGAYPGTVSDPKGAGSGSDRVYRGGGWDASDADRCRVGFRSGNHPSYINSLIGFRACLAAVEDLLHAADRIPTDMRERLGPFEYLRERLGPFKYLSGKRFYGTEGGIQGWPYHLVADRDAHFAYDTIPVKIYVTQGRKTKPQSQELTIQCVQVDKSGLVLLDDPLMNAPTQEGLRIWVSHPDLKEP